MKRMTHVGRLFSCLCLVAGGLLTIAPTPCNLRIVEYPGSSEKEGREGTSDVFAVDHEIVQPYDQAIGAASGVRQHRALTVLKVIDKATPGLHKALVTGQQLKEAVLDFYRIDPATRQEVKYYTITLRNVRLVGVKTMMPTSFLPENESYRHMEEIRMVYQSIEWAWLPDKVVEMDEWRSRGATAQAGASASDNGTQPTVEGPPVKPSNAPPDGPQLTNASSVKQHAN